MHLRQPAERGTHPRSCQVQLGLDQKFRTSVRQIGKATDRGPSDCTITHFRPTIPCKTLTTRALWVLMFPRQPRIHWRFRDNRRSARRIRPSALSALPSDTNSLPDRPTRPDLALPSDEVSQHHDPGRFASAASAFGPKLGRNGLRDRPTNFAPPSDKFALQSEFLALGPEKCRTCIGFFLPCPAAVRILPTL